MIFVAVIAEDIGDADLVARNVKIFALHGDFAVADEFEPARGELSGCVIGKGRRYGQHQCSECCGSHSGLPLALINDLERFGFRGKRSPKRHLLLLVMPN